MKKYYHFLGIPILVIILLKVDLYKIALYFSRVDIMSFLLINLLILPVLFLRSYRWRYVLRLQGINYSLKEAFISYLGGIFVGIVTPGRIGESIKALYLKEEKKIPLHEGLASVFLDRFFDLYLLILFGWIGFYNFLNKNINSNLGFLLITLFLMVVTLLLINKSLLEKVIKLIYKPIFSNFDRNFFQEKFKNFFISIKKIITGRSYFAYFLTILAYLLYFWHCYLLSRLININISYTSIIFLVSMSNFLSMLPITILGIGTREASILYFFSLLGLDAESALTYSFLLFFSFYVISGILAFVGWYIKGKRKIIFASS